MTGALEYARALYMLSEEVGTADAVADDARTVLSALSDNEGYTELLDTPALSTEKRIALIGEAFSSLDRNLVNLMKLLSEKRLSRLIPSVMKEYINEHDRARGIERVEAITAVPLTDLQVAALTEKLAKKTGKTIIVKNTVDKKILGGMKLRYMGKQLDGSLESRFEALEESLRTLVV